MAGSPGKCCGDDPSNSPATATDNARILTSAGGDLLCTVDSGTPAIHSTSDNTGTIIAISGEAFDVVAGQSYWYVCDSNKDSDHGDDIDHLYEFWNGCRADETCRYPVGGGSVCGGLFCGAIAGSDVVQASASAGTPVSHISDVDDGTDGMWFNSAGTLLGSSTEDIGSASDPLSVVLSGLDSGAEYLITIELGNTGTGNDFYARVGSSGDYIRLGASYEPWTEIQFQTVVTGTQSTQVQFYYEGGAAQRMGVRNVRAVKVGINYAPQEPAVNAGGKEYLCGTDLDLNSNTLTGERFIECCGDGNCINPTQAAAAGDIITASGVDWVCGNDNEFHDTSDVNGNPFVCEMLGHVWSGGTCCGNDPGETLTWSWRGEEQGCCYQSADQCLVSNSGSEMNTNKPDTFYSTGEGPHCITASQFVLNQFCDDGTWRSRNKETADKLLNIVKDADADHYVIFCDDYRNALAYYDYLTSGNEPLEPAFLENTSCQVGSREYPCYNTFCIASAPDQGLAVVAGSYNFPRSVAELEEIFGAVGQCSPAEQEGDGKFHKCTDNLWLNNATRSFVYSEQSISVEGGLFGWADDMFAWLKSKFDPFFAWIGINKYALAEEVIDKADTYESFYVFHSTDKEVFARQEGVYTDTGYDAMLAVDFTGFESAICDQIEASFPGSCTDEGADTKYVSAIESNEEQAALFDLWQEISSALRVN